MINSKTKLRISLLIAIVATLLALLICTTCKHPTDNVEETLIVITLPGAG